MTELTVIAAFVEQRAISSLSTPSRAAVRSTCGAAEAIHCTHWGGSLFVCGFYQVSSQCHPRIYTKMDEKPVKTINSSPKSSRKGGGVTDSVRTVKMCWLMLKCLMRGR